jgi:hypothetical protein
MQFVTEVSLAGIGESASVLGDVITSVDVKASPSIYRELIDRMSRSALIIRQLSHASESLRTPIKTRQFLPHFARLEPA